MACSLEYNEYFTCWHLLTGCTWRLSSQDSREVCVTSMRIPRSWKSMAWAQSLRPHSTWAKSVPTCTRPKSKCKFPEKNVIILLLSKGHWWTEIAITSNRPQFCPNTFTSLNIKLFGDLRSVALSFLFSWKSLLESCQYFYFAQKHQWNQLKISRF